MNQIRSLFSLFHLLNFAFSDHHSFTLLGPVQRDLPNTDDAYQKLIDLKNFTFLINPKVCRNFTKLLLVTIVFSKWTYFEKRMQIRERWDEPVWTKVIFLIGLTPAGDISHDIQKESDIYGDIVMGNFIDSYRNLTYKHVMGLKWVTHHCPMAKYVLKVDDDVEVDPKMLRLLLTQRLSPWGARELLACNLLSNLKVPRKSTDEDSLYITQEEYPLSYYPISCYGWVILYSQDVVRSLLRAAQASPYLWVDDVFITGMCRLKSELCITPIGDLTSSWRQFQIHIWANATQKTKELGFLTEPIFHLKHSYDEIL
ncbi:beta-1,3-galactosyltransferase 5-like [Plodia interpunctella]|uniref:beta-1,3-galactosyltransferase 5-like n=1 Tax=Plodia interpunctella TaxID=58824 RepID=UPI002367605C|nr:beta-1,3-galactosyltransferase 5-like [Plodia interpunctella]